MYRLTMQTTTRLLEYIERIFLSIDFFIDLSRQHLFLESGGTTLLLAV